MIKELFSTIDEVFIYKQLKRIKIMLACFYTE